MYYVNVGDVFDDLECIGKINRRLDSGFTANFYVMKCKVCGRIKEMLAPTIYKKHGTTHKACGKGLKTKDPVFYDRWEAMRTRTGNPNYHASNCYSEKGIDSEEFKYFIDFYDKMYDSYKELADKIGSNNTSLERIDNNKSYSSENCKWIDKHEQPKHTNKIVEFKIIFPDGSEEIAHNVREYALKHGLNDSAIRDVMKGKTQSHKGLKFERISP